MHDRFGTSTVTLDGFTYDLARARTERYPYPGALPEVEPAGLTEDLGRRDFTVNAIAAALGGPRPGTLSSVAGALDDLEDGTLRVLHHRSFLDDPTRLLRLARYASRLGFSIEPDTLELARQAIGAGALGTVSGNRIGAELRLLSREKDPVAGFEKLDELGLDRAIDEQFGLTDPEYARRALALLPPDGRPDLLVLGLATAGSEGSALREFLDRLAFEAHEREVISAVALRAETVAGVLARAERPSQIADALAGASTELAAAAGALGPEAQAREWLERLRHVELEIDGDDLLAAGVPQGAAIGVGLRAALTAALDGFAPGREEQLDGRCARPGAAASLRRRCSSGRTSSSGTDRPATTRSIT